MEKLPQTALENGEFSEQETQERFERLVRAALNTKPKPLKSMGRKGVPAQSKKRMRAIPHGKGRP
jgi:hypothetical protein